jgi:SAM-dependent methyltransferase
MKERNPNISELAVDVGAGSGAFALVLKRQKYFREVLALDFSKACIEQCKKIGLYSKLGSVELLEDNSVDLLTMNDLIEHLSYPKSFLEKCFNVLRKSGFISIACPNGEGFDFKVLKEKTINITPPEHLNYFNPGSIKSLLEQIGFNQIFIEARGTLDVQIVEREINDRKIDISKNNEWLYYLFKECTKCAKDNFQKYLSKNNLSSPMLIFAQK